MPFHDKLGPFRPIFKTLEKLTGTPFTNIKKWLYIKIKYVKINPLKSKRKKTEENKIHIPSLRKVLEEYRDLLNELVDTINRIPELEIKLRELEEKHEEDVDKLAHVDELLMRWDSFHLFQEYDPYSAVFDKPNQPIHQFDQDSYPDIFNRDPSMMQNMSRLRPTVTPDTFFLNERNRIMSSEKGGPVKKMNKGGKFTKPVISNAKDRQSLIKKIKAKLNK